MATPPVFSAAPVTAFNNTTPKSTGAFTAAVGTVIVGATLDETRDTTENYTVANTGTAQTWTEYTATNSTTSFGWVQAVSTTVGATLTSQTINVTRVAGATEIYGAAFAAFTASDGIGATVASTVGASGAPTLDITTQFDNSAVFYAFTDWNPVDGATRTHRTVNGYTPTAGNGQELAYTYAAGLQTGYVAYIPDAGPAGVKTVGLSAPTGQAYVGVAVEVRGTGVTVPRVPLPVSFGATGAWIAPLSSVTVTPVYPADDNLDLITAVLAIKPNTATVATPASWTAGPVQPVGGGTQGAGTGAVQARMFTRESNGALSGGSQAFAITAGSSPVAHMKAWKYNTTGFTAAAWEPVTSTSYSRTVASTTFGGTGATNLNLAAGDVLLYVSLSSDDQSTTHTINTLTAAGCTLATRVQSPAGTIVNTQGNDISAACAYALVTAGASTGAPVATVTGNTAETGGGVFFRIRATGVAALAQVTTTRATTWKTAAQVTDTQASTWAVQVPLGQIGSTRATTWKTTARVTDTQASTWKTAAAAASTRATTWTVTVPIAAPSVRADAWTSTVTVTVEQGTEWTVGTPVTHAQATTWGVWQAAADSRAATWQVSQSVTGAQATTWEVETIQQVTATHSTTWETSTRVTSTHATTWAALSAATDTQTTSWAAETTVTATRASTWRVASAVASTRATTWTALAWATDTQATSWAALARVTDTQATSWAALSRATDTQAASWAVWAAVTATRATTWLTATVAASSTRVATWAVAGHSTSQRAAMWDVAGVLTTVTDTRASTWAVAAYTTVTRSDGWDVLAAGVTAARGDVWAVVGSATSPRATAWTVTVPTAASTRTTAWAATAQVSSARAATWNAETTVTTARATVWDVGGSPVSSRGATWNVDAQVVAFHDTTWGTLTSADDSRATTWAVNSGGAVTTRATTWDVLGSAAVTTTRGATWKVVVDLFSIRAAGWQTRKQISAGVKSTKWAVKRTIQGGAAGSTRLTRWDTFTHATSDRADSWNTGSWITYFEDLRAESGGLSTWEGGGRLGADHAAGSLTVEQPMAHWT